MMGGLSMLGMNIGPNPKFTQPSSLRIVSVARGQQHEQGQH